MLEQFRDVMIIVMAFMAIGATLVFALLTIITFRKVSQILDSAQGVFADLRGLSSLLSDTVVRPTIRGASFIAGARRVLSSLSKRAKVKEERSGKGK